MDDIVKMGEDLADKASSSEEFDLEAFVRSWETEFNFINPDPEENSDFDSDNEINPIDTIEKGIAPSSKISITNNRNKKPI